MPLNDLDCEELTRTLIENFNILADEVQLLCDRKIILEHKLNYAHTQVSSRALSLARIPTSYHVMRNFSSRS